MNFKWKYAAALSLLALASMDVSAQMEKITDAVYQKTAGQLSSLRDAAKNPYLKKYLDSVDRKMSEAGRVAAARVAADVNSKPEFTGKVVHYAVPPMSDLQRLPDQYPLDGKALAPVRIISAQDEYEPGSFVVYPLEDLGKVEFKLSEFKTADGKVFPASELDLKVVKVWYQNGNGWYSYFSDTELKLCPELLLNDEDLIKVDTENVQNYARLTEKDGSVSYYWLTPPLDIDKRVGYPPWRSFRSFQCMKPNFKDAATLQPVTLNKGQFKQFFLTAHATANQAPGVYRGSVSMVKNGASLGTIPVSVKVLPFSLPPACTYADPEREILISSYSYISFELILQENGGDVELMKKQLYATLENQVKHNQNMHMLRGNETGYEWNYTVDVMKRVGMRMDHVISSNALAPYSDPLMLRHHAKQLRQYYQKVFGHTNVYQAYGDEPPTSWVRMMFPLYEAYQNEGIKFFIAGRDQVLYAAGHIYDFYNTSHTPEDPEGARCWNEIGNAYVSWYATQHIGTENPAYNRRQNGLTPYLANYSSFCNYAHHYGPYNDRSHVYKPMVFAYGDGKGVIDTLQWEGFREGIDDIRYATAMKRLAQEASEHRDMNVKYAGRNALKFLAFMKPTSDNMDTARLEMISRILELRALLKK